MNAMVFGVALAAAAVGGAPPPADSYVRVEVKGTADCPPNAAFDPRADLRAESFIGPTVGVGQQSPTNPPLFLLARDREQFEWIKSHRGRRVVVAGDLEFVAVPQGKYTVSPLDRPPLIRHFVRIRDIRLADAN